MNKKIILDGLANYIFFMPLVSIITGLLAHWTWEQFLYYAIFSATIIGFGFGIIFGRFLNWWRKVLRYE